MILGLALKEVNKIKKKLKPTVKDSNREEIIKDKQSLRFLKQSGLTINR